MQKWRKDLRSCTGLHTGQSWSRSFQDYVYIPEDKTSVNVNGVYASLDGMSRFEFFEVSQCMFVQVFKL